MLKNSFCRSDSITTWRTLGLALAGGIVIEAGLYLFSKGLQYLSGQQNKEPVFKTLFFPDAKIACKDHFTQRHGCTRSVCRFSHDENLSYGQLLKYLSSATHSIDVAVYCITGRELVAVLVELLHKSVIVRVITDDETAKESSSQVGFLRSQGIQVRQDRTPFYMHHKFFIVDGHTLINGSFNWTKSAITGNNENVTITNHRNIVAAYKAEYEKLWEKFDPQNYQ